MRCVPISAYFGPKYSISAFSRLYSEYGPFKFLARIKHFGDMCFTSRIKFWRGKKCKKSNFFRIFGIFSHVEANILSFRTSHDREIFAILHHEVVN